MNKVGNLHNKNILFLQGPMGPFFKQLDKIFRKRGAVTYKIGFNAGDCLFSNRDNYIPYRGTAIGWQKFIENFLVDKQIDKIFLFGDCRFYQKVARKIAAEHDIEVYAFEEGYVRPHYITMEKSGVNGFSQISREADFYKELQKKEIQPPLHAKKSKTKMVASATIYYALSNLLRFRYPHYIHHRSFSAIEELFYAMRGIWRKGYYKIIERKYEKLVSSELSKKYYFIPLQTHNDFQILQHSNYSSVKKFINEVIESFAQYAPKDTYLVFKHHPVDRGRKNYHSFIKKQAKLFGIKDRTFVFHDVYLPACLQHAIGTVTINSTVGLTSIGYGIPTMTLGDAVYDIEGLTNKGASLDEFWHHYKKPDDELYQKYINYLIDTTQLNGSYYGLLPKEFYSEEMYQPVL